MFAQFIEQVERNYHADRNDIIGALEKYRAECEIMNRFTLTDEQVLDACQNFLYQKLDPSTLTAKKVLNYSQAYLYFALLEKRI